MLLHVSVILFTERGWLPNMHHRSHDQGGLHPGGASESRGDLHPGGWVVCIQVGSGYRGAGSVSGGRGLHRRGSAYRGDWADPPQPTGTGKAGGTHSTGLFSCFLLSLPAKIIT